MLIKIKFLTIYSLALLFIIASTTNSFAQSAWERFYGDNDSEYISEVKETNDGGYIAVGSIRDEITEDMDVYWIKMDPNGNVQWTNSYGGGKNDSGSSIIQTDDDGYLILGSTNNYGLLGSKNYFLIKMNSSGTVLWTRTYGGDLDEEASSILETSDGGYILLGSRSTSTSINNKERAWIFLIKINENGDQLWEKKYYRPYSVLPGNPSIQEVSNGGYIVSMIWYDWPVGEDITKLGALYRLNENGDQLWEKSYDFGDDSNIFDVEETMDGGFVFVGYIEKTENYKSYRQGYIQKVSSRGKPMWLSHTIGSPFSVDVTRDGGIVCTGRNNDAIFPMGQGIVESNEQLFIQKFNASGKHLWVHNYGGSGEEYGSSIEETSDGGFIIGGKTTSYGMGSRDAYIIRTDSTGGYLNGSIQGSIFQDLDLSCNYTTGDINLEGIVVKASLGNATGFDYYGTTDSLGHYNIPCQLGTYIITTPNLSPYYTLSCPTNSGTITAQANDTINFPLEMIASCPLMEVDVSSPILRKIVPSTYTIQYCNNGTAIAHNVALTVNVDSFLNIQGFSHPPSNQSGNVYTFNVGTVDVGECGTIYIDVQVDNAALLGQTHCVEVYITPDSFCTSNPWTGMLLDVNGTCQNDSVIFTIINLNPTGTLSPRTYWVFEDDIIMNVGTIDTSNGGDTVIVIAATPRKFYRIEVAQESGIPWTIADSIASAFVEGCVPDSNGEFNVGLPTHFPNGHAPTFMAIDCRENGGSYDPNNKIAQPLGYGTNHYISANQYIDYQINFQNTGTDTAFYVTLIDTLSTNLDPASIQMTAASHPYTWQLKGSGILEVKFDMIMLPDSNINEPASHGFAKFRIQQKANNPVGTIINNFADIYFDLNAPIRTNTTYHEIGANYYNITLTPFESGVESLLEPELVVNVFPNPFTQQTTIQIEGAIYKELTLLVYDLTGTQVATVSSFDTNTIQLKREQLNTGVYLFNLLGNGNPIRSGKIVAQ